MSSSDAIDVVAPVAETVSTTQNGSTCVIDVGTTAFAAGEVSGLAALLVAKYPDYNPAQIAAVIMETAYGTTADRSPVDGAGTIQANEAMTRQLRINRDGTVVQAQQQLDQTPPVPLPDPTTTRSPACADHCCGGACWPEEACCSRCSSGRCSAADPAPPAARPRATRQEDEGSVLMPLPASSRSAGSRGSVSGPGSQFRSPRITMWRRRRPFALPVPPAGLHRRGWRADFHCVAGGRPPTCTAEGCRVADSSWSSNRGAPGTSISHVVFGRLDGFRSFVMIEDALAPTYSLPST